LKRKDKRYHYVVRWRLAWSWWQAYPIKPWRKTWSLFRPWLYVASNLQPVNQEKAQRFTLKQAQKLMKTQLRGDTCQIVDVNTGRVVKEK
jgi:hypothetical protein